MSKKLTRDFYLEDAVLLSQKLIGKKLIHKTPFGTLSGMIVETEAYRGMDDQASHAYPNRNTPRTRIQFGQGGFAYVYKIYGMYDCFNVVTGEQDQPMSSLIRAIMPLEGLKEMYTFRKVKKEYDLGNGPGKLCAALKITKEQYGMDLCGDELYLEDYKSFTAKEIGVSPRINIDYAKESINLPWRFYLKDSPYVSKVAKKYRVDYGESNSVI